MEKRISFDQFQSVKRVAQACNPLMVKREKIKKQIEKLAAEYKNYDTQIASLESGIKQVVGFRVEQLVKKVIESGVDANGQPKKTTKYLPTEIVTYDETKKQFIITLSDTIDTQNTPTNEESTSEETVELLDEPNEEATEYSENVPVDAPIF